MFTHTQKSRARYGGTALALAAVLGFGSAYAVEECPYWDDECIEFAEPMIALGEPDPYHLGGEVDAQFLQALAAGEIVVPEDGNYGVSEGGLLPVAFEGGDEAESEYANGS